MWRKRESKMKQSEIIQKISDKIVAKLSQGVNPWRKPWSLSRLGKKYQNPEVLAYNYVSGDAYSGINQVLLDAGYYVSFKQALALDGKPAKGKGQLVVFSKATWVDVKDTKQVQALEEALAKCNDAVVIDDTIVMVYKQRKYRKNETTGQWQVFASILKEYFVWNIKDCGGIRKINRPTITELPKVATNAEVDGVITAYCERTHLTLKHALQDRAYYSPANDEVILPIVEIFEALPEYYSVAFHELGHSTGHASRLKRDGIVKFDGFGGENYSKEELIAEITAAICTASLGIDTDDTLNNSVAYLQNWAEHIKNNKSIQNSIVSATTKAGDAYKLIMNLA